MNHKFINLLSSKNYQYLKNNLLKLNSNFNDVNIKTEIFPDGEHYWKIENCHCIKGNPAIYISGTIDDNAIFELYNICCSLVQNGCSSLHIIIPYFAYSTMERAIHDGEIVTAKNIARLLSSIPMSANGNHIYLMDLHSLAMQYYFEGNLHPIHLTSQSVIDKMIKDIQKQSKNLVIASADMGRAKWIEKIANNLNLPSAYIMKKRISGKKTEVVALNADVKNCDIVIFDDMIRSGSSIINAVNAYKSIGANKIYVACVHGVFVDSAIEKLEQTKLIEKIYTTNSHAKTESIKNNFVKIFDITDVIISGISKILD